MKFLYAGWTDAAPLNLTLKDALKLAKQLKSYVKSSKFIRLGSKVNKINLLGILTKAPIKDVIYYNSPDGGDPISALLLDDLIHTAVINKDPLMLKRVSLYRFYTSLPITTKKLLMAQRLKDYKKRLTRNVALWGTGLGAVNAAIPILYRKSQDKSINRETIKSAALLALAGVAAGITVAGFTTNK